MARAHRSPVLVVGLVVVVVLSGGCREDTVRLSVRPSPGERARYRIEVRAVAVTTIGDQAPRRTVEDAVLEARHRVVASGPDGSRVEVRLSQGGRPAGTFVVRFDRAAQPVDVERTDGQPTGTLGELGLSEIFPAAAAAPPDRPLGPGDRWRIDEPLGLGQPDAARLTGRGRLVSLQVAEGRRLAHVESVYRLPVSRTGSDTDGRLQLVGSVGTTARVAYDLDDAVVASVRARTRGRYEVTLLPPPGVAGVPVPGTLTVEVDSTTLRLL